MIETKNSDLAHKVGSRGARLVVEKALGAIVERDVDALKHAALLRLPRSPQGLVDGVQSALTVAPPVAAWTVARRRAHPVLPVLPI